MLPSKRWRKEVSLILWKLYFQLLVKRTYLNGMIMLDTLIKNKTKAKVHC